MSAPVGLHADQLALNVLCGDNMLSAGNISTNAGYAILNNTNVAASNTVTALKEAIDAAPVHADESYSKARFKLAVDLGNYDGSFTDARLASLTTVQGLVELTNASITDGILRQVPE